MLFDDNSAWGPSAAAAAADKISTWADWSGTRHGHLYVATSRETPYTVKLIDLLEYDEFTNKSTFISGSSGKSMSIFVAEAHTA